MNTLFIAQVAVPLVLILWRALAPPRSMGLPIGGHPLPIVFDGHFPVGGDRIGLP